MMELLATMILSPPLERIWIKTVTLVKEEGEVNAGQTIVLGMFYQAYRIEASSPWNEV